MSTVINYKQLEGQTITAQNDRIMYDTLSLGNGVLYGCNLNFVSLNNVHIDAGYILIKGGLVEIEEGDIQCEMPEAPGIGRIYVRINLSDVDNTIQLLTMATTGDLPALEQDEDFNFDNGVFEYELGTYEANNVSVLSVTETFEMLTQVSVAELKKLAGGILNTMEEIEANTKPNKIAGALAVKELNANLRVQYDPETDFLFVLYDGKRKDLIKVGLNSWLIWSNGILDPTVTFDMTSGAEKIINDKLLEFKAFTCPGNQYQQYVTFPVDASKYDYVKLTGYGHRNFGNQNDLPKIGLTGSSGTAPTEQIQEMPYDVEQTYTLNLTGYTSTIYVSINVEYRVPASSVQCGTSALFTEIECI